MHDNREDMRSIESLDLNLLLVFDALLRTRSVTLAAEQTGMGQSGMSGALKRLRVALDDPLFVKTGGGMTPTTLALQLAGPIQAGLSQIRDALGSREAFDAATCTRRFVIYLSDTGQLVFLPPLMEAVRQRAPGVRVHTLQCDMKTARQLISDGDIDLAMGLFVDFDDGLRRNLLFRSPYVCIASASHPTIRETLSLDDFGKAAHLVYRPAVGSHRAVDSLILDECAKHGINRREVLQVSHGLGVAELIARTDLIACVPSELGQWCERRGDVKVFPLPVTIPAVELSQYWHERAHRDAGLAWLRYLVQEVFAERAHASVGLRS
jgi:DNA-binding transcriptional LysR family regulator